MRLNYFQGEPAIRSPKADGFLPARSGYVLHNNESLELVDSGFVVLSAKDVVIQANRFAYLKALDPRKLFLRNGQVYLALSSSSGFEIVGASGRVSFGEGDFSWSGDLQSLRVVVFSGTAVLAATASHPEYRIHSGERLEVSGDVIHIAKEYNANPPFPFSTERESDTPASTFSPEVRMLWFQNDHGRGRVHYILRTIHNWHIPDYISVGDVWVLEKGRVVRRDVRQPFRKIAPRGLAVGDTVLVSVPETYTASVADFPVYISGTPGNEIRVTQRSGGDVRYYLGVVAGEEETLRGIQLQPGTNEIEVSVVVSGRHTQLLRQVTVYYQRSRLIPRLSSPESGISTQLAEISITGSASPYQGVVLGRGDTILVKTIADQFGQFEFPHVRLLPGINKFHVHSAGEDARLGVGVELVVIRDELAPMRIVFDNREGIYAYRGRLRFSGFARGAAEVIVTVEGRATHHPVRRDGRFLVRDVELDETVATVDVFATDRAGNQSPTEHLYVRSFNHQLRIPEILNPEKLRQMRFAEVRVPNFVIADFPSVTNGDEVILQGRLKAEPAIYLPVLKGLADSGVTIHLYGLPVPQTTVVDASGHFVFRDLPLGNRNFKLFVNEALRLTPRLGFSEIVSLHEGENIMRLRLTEERFEKTLYIQAQRGTVVGDSYPVVIQYQPQVIEKLLTVTQDRYPPDVIDVQVNRFGSRIAVDVYVDDFGSGVAEVLVFGVPARRRSEGIYEVEIERPYSGVLQVPVTVSDVAGNRETQLIPVP